MAKNILCIDDDPFYKDLYSAILESRGYRVISAMNPAEGWKEIQKAKPDLITLDIMMPEAEGFFDGYGLLKKLRGDAATKNLPVILISALGDPEDVEHGMAAGASAYIPKQEMNPEILATEVKKWIGEK